MLLVILFLGIIFIAIGVLISLRTNCPEDNPMTYIGFIFGILLTLASLIMLIIGVSNIVSGRTIDEKINIYETENSKIELSITKVIENYLEHELNIYESLDGENIETLVTIYPQIKSNTLVENQMKIYIDNNNIIKNLKVDKVNLKIWKWWVYFG